MIIVYYDEEGNEIKIDKSTGTVYLNGKQL